MGEKLPLLLLLLLSPLLRLRTLGVEGLRNELAAALPATGVVTVGPPADLSPVVDTVDAAVAAC
jgi:hypothetical protein